MFSDTLNGNQSLWGETTNTFCRQALISHVLRWGLQDWSSYYSLNAASVLHEPQGFKNLSSCFSFLIWKQRYCCKLVSRVTPDLRGLPVTSGFCATCSEGTTRVGTSEVQQEASQTASRTALKVTVSHLTSDFIFYNMLKVSETCRIFKCYWERSCTQVIFDINIEAPMRLCSEQLFLCVSTSCKNSLQALKRPLRDIPKGTGGGGRGCCVDSGSLYWITSEVCFQDEDCTSHEHHLPVIVKQ